MKSQNRALHSSRDNGNLFLDILKDWFRFHPGNQWPPIGIWLHILHQYDIKCQMGLYDNSNGDVHGKLHTMWYLIRADSCSINTHFKAETKWPPLSIRHFQTHFLEWKCRIFFFQILLIFPYSPIHNNHVLFQIMAWRRLGDKPLFAPKMP